MPATAIYENHADTFASVFGEGRGSGRPVTKRADFEPITCTLKGAPNQLARTVAGQLWPDVQKQTKLAAGIYGFSCAGHGGVIAVIGKADLDPAHVQAARDAGLTELAVRAEKKTYSTAAGYARKDVQNLINLGYPGAELWVGEEDCDWATILYDQPRLLASAINSGYFSDTLTMKDIAGAVESYNESFLAALYPDHRAIPGGQLDRARRRQALLDAGEYLRSSATSEGAVGVNHDGPPPTRDELQVRVTFTNADGDTREHVMNADTYRAIPLAVHATVQDYRALGEVSEPLDN